MHMREWRVLMNYFRILCIKDFPFRNGSGVTLEEIGQTDCGMLP